MVWRDGRDECWHCGSTEHDTAAHPHDETSEEHKAEVRIAKAKLAVLDAAIAWRESDEAEPIGSPVPNEKLLGLAMAVDALLSLPGHDTTP